MAESFSRGLIRERPSFVEYRSGRNQGRLSPVRQTLHCDSSTQLSTCLAFGLMMNSKRLSAAFQALLCLAALCLCPLPAMAGEADLEIPDLKEAKFFGGTISGHSLLFYGSFVIAGTLGQNQQYWGRTFAGSSLATIPVVVIFLLLLRYYVQGVASTGVKG